MTLLQHPEGQLSLDAELRSVFHDLKKSEDGEQNHELTLIKMESSVSVWSDISVDATWAVSWLGCAAFPSVSECFWVFWELWRAYQRHMYHNTISMFSFSLSLASSPQFQLQMFDIVCSLGWTSRDRCCDLPSMVREPPPPPNTDTRPLTPHVSCVRPPPAPLQPAASRWMMIHRWLQLQLHSPDNQLLCAASPLLLDSIWITKHRRADGVLGLWTEDFFSW